MASPGTYAAQSGTGTPTSQPTSGGQFPTQISAQQLAQLGISSTDMPRFLQGNAIDQTAAQEWLAYTNMTQTERQAMQQALVDAGLLSATNATGELDNSTAKTAYLNAIGAAGEQGTSVQAYVANASQGGLGTLQNQIASNATAAQKTVSGAENVSATLENPSTLTQDITTAFDNALGYAPDPAQIQSFISQIQGQDVGYAEGAVNQNKAAAQAVLNQSKSETTALNAMGTDGVDTFLSAYRNSVHGLPGGAASTGPQVSTGAELTASLPGTSVVPNSQQGKGVPLRGGGTEETLRAVNSQGQQVVTTNRPVAAAAANAPVYGGEYALAPAMWDQGLALLGTQGAAWRKQYSSAGTAPTKVQDAVASALATNIFEKTGSWTSVAQQMAQGSPEATSNSQLSSFANGVAGSVTNAINSLQNQINTTPVVTTKTTAPDATAEAALAAKQADPIGYEAANYAAAGDLLSRMLQGAPQLADYSTTDTFSGPAPVPAAVSANGTGA